MSTEQNNNNDQENLHVNSPAGEEALLSMEDKADATPQSPPIQISGVVETLGTATTIVDNKAKEMEENRELAKNIGFRKITHDLFPSRGMSYQPEMEVQFRAASVEEIKHYSGMDENDMRDVDEHVQSVLKACCKINKNGKILSYKDLEETDKIYTLFSIRDLSIKAHGKESVIHQSVSCPKCGETHKYEIDNRVFGYYDIPPGVMKWYSESERCFVINNPKTGIFKVYIPTIGVMAFISDYIREKEIQKRNGSGGFYDRQFLTFMQFMVPDWRMLNDKWVDSQYLAYKNNWPLERHDAMVSITNKINIGIKPSMSVPCKTDKCGETLNALIRFRDGYKSILSISDIGRELFED